jgi:hypothetical protein
MTADLGKGRGGAASGSNLHQRRERVDYDLFLESQPRSSTR